MEISNYLSQMVKHNASDLFFSAGAPVNIKIEGHTRPLGENNLNGKEVRQLAYSIIGSGRVDFYVFSTTLSINSFNSRFASGSIAVNSS